jgi:methyl-accepting chemotaxis protein
MKIGTGFGIALVILVIVGAVSYLTTIKLTETADMVTQTHKVLEDVDEVMQAVTDAETSQRGYIITSQETYLEPYNRSVERIPGLLDDLRQSIRKDLAFGNLGLNREQRVEKLGVLANKRLSTLKQHLDVDKAQGIDATKAAILNSAGNEEMSAIRQEMNALRADENGLLATRAADAAASVTTAKLTIFIGTAAAFLILAVVAFLITRNISGPLSEITATAERIAAGDLSASVAPSKRRDEVGALTKAFSSMTDSLRGTAAIATRIAAGDLKVTVKPLSDKDTLGNAFGAMVENLQRLISQAAEGISVLSSSANQISTSTTQLASSAAQTATAISEATTTVEEVRQTAQLSSQKSKSVSESTHRMAQVSRAGTQSTEEAIAGINRIRQQMDAVAESMVRLSEQSQTIGQIVTTVEDLSAQSNILAVNASIEAAKAGEHGKGFAVVAQEVRSLAEQSKQATKQVRSILMDIQKATSAAVMATEQGSKAVEAGVKQAGEAGQSIQTLSNSVSEAAQTSTQIAASSQQQLVGVDQVAMAMESIKQASVQNLASAKQLEAAAHSLKDLGGRLRQTVSQYKV